MAVERIIGTETGKSAFEKTDRNVVALDASLVAHKADIVSDTDGVHGLKIESGTWTPTLVGSSVAGTNTYSIRTGKYYKIGKLVIAEFSIVTSLKDATMAGALRITGLPFALTVGEFAPTFSRVEGITLGASYNNISGYASSNVINIIQMKGTWDSLLATEISNNTRFTGVLLYYTS